MKDFKILKNYDDKRPNLPTVFPWHLLNEENAKRFHSQTLERLNERGGLSMEEIYCNITGTDYFKVSFNKDKILIWINQQIQKGAGLGKENGISPCPFCGSKEGENVILGYEYPKYRIACVPCGVIMLDDRKDKVIANWNRRV
jgi:hypothetical protein